MLFDTWLLKERLVRDRCHRIAAILEELVQVMLLPTRPCRMVVGHIVAGVVAVDPVLGIVIAIETAHYQRSDCLVSKKPLEQCFTYFPG